MPDQLRYPLPDAPTVIAVNYHRIGDTDPANPLHRLHTVPTPVFTRQLDLMQRLGQIISLDQARAARDLAEVNFVICFDDVPLAAMTGIDLMRARGLPVTVSVCGQLADQGWGSRDKVYAIERYLTAEVIGAHVRARLPDHARHLEALSFYHLTKCADLDPGFVLDELVDPLFAAVEAQACSPSLLMSIVGRVGVTGGERAW